MAITYLQTAPSQTDLIIVLGTNQILIVTVSENVLNLS